MAFFIAWIFFIHQISNTIKNTVGSNFCSEYPLLSGSHIRHGPHFIQKLFYCCTFILPFTFSWLEAV